MRRALACGLYLACAAPAQPGADAQPACTATHDPAPIVASGDPGSITIHIGPTPGNAVLVRDADGTRSVTLDGLGDATAAIRPPAIVTGVTSEYLETITGVEPGDQLCLACPPDQPTPVRDRLTVPARTDAVGYNFANGETIQYGAPGPSTTLSATLGGPHDVLAVAGDASGAVIGWTAAPAQTLTDGATIALGPWQTPATFTATYDHVPDGASVVIDRAERSSANALPAFAFAKTSGGAQVTQAASSSGAPLMVVDTEVFVADGASVESQAMYDTVPASLDYHVDLAQALLPWLDAPSYDGCAHALAWTERGGATGDGTWAQITWDPSVGREWSVLVAPGTTRIDLDDLPAPIAPPDGLESIYLTSYDIDAIGDYAAMRGWNRATLGPGAVPHRRSSASVSFH